MQSNPAPNPRAGGQHLIGLPLMGLLDVNQGDRSTGRIHRMIGAEVSAIFNDQQVANGQ